MNQRLLAKECPPFMHSSCQSEAVGSLHCSREIPSLLPQSPSFRYAALKTPRILLLILESSSLHTISYELLWRSPQLTRALRLYEIVEPILRYASEDLFRGDMLSFDFRVVRGHFICYKGILHS